MNIKCIHSFRGAGLKSLRYWQAVSVFEFNENYATCPCFFQPLLFHRPGKLKVLTVLEDNQVTAATAPCN